MSQPGAHVRRIARRRGAAEGARLAGMSCISVHRSSPLERIELIKCGVPAREAKRIISVLVMDVPFGQAAFLRALKLPAATVNRKAKQGRILSTAESERVIGMARLVGQVEAMVQESGAAEGFDAAAWLSRWLQEPLPSLGGARPLDLLDTMEGQSLVSAALAQMQGGAYA